MKRGRESVSLYGLTPVRFTVAGSKPTADVIGPDPARASAPCDGIGNRAVDVGLLASRSRDADLICDGNVPSVILGGWWTGTAVRERTVLKRMRAPVLAHGRALPRKMLGRDYTVSNRPGDVTALCPGLNYHRSINIAGGRDAQAAGFRGELKALQDKARDLKSRKVQQLGELVIATGADSLSVDELAGALIVLTETKDAGKREAWARRGAAFFQSRARRTAPAAERHTGGTRAQPGGVQPSTGSKGAA